MTTSPLLVHLLRHSLPLLLLSERHPPAVARSAGSRGLAPHRVVSGNSGGNSDNGPLVIPPVRSILRNFASPGRSPWREPPSVLSSVWNKPRYSYGIHASSDNNSPAVALLPVYPMHHALPLALMDAEIMMDLAGYLLSPLPGFVEDKSGRHDCHLPLLYRCVRLGGHRYLPFSSLADRHYHGLIL